MYGLPLTPPPPPPSPPPPLSPRPYISETTSGCKFRADLDLLTQAAKMLALQKPTGPGASWPKALPRAVALPADCTAGDLLEVIEFVQVCM